MGSDKGLIEKDGEPWALLAAKKLTGIGIPVMISISEKQLESYSQFFPRDMLIADNVGIEGPLKGLLSVYENYPESDILLMACDLVDMDEETIGQLVKHYNSQSQHHFYVYHDQFAEPFCAIYTAKGIQPVYQKAKANSLEKFSFQRILEDDKTFRIPILNKSAFRNYNTIEGHHQQ